MNKFFRKIAALGLFICYFASQNAVASGLPSTESVSRKRSLTAERFERLQALVDEYKQNEEKKVLAQIMRTFFDSVVDGKITLEALFVYAFTMDLPELLEIIAKDDPEYINNSIVQAYPSSRDPIKSAIQLEYVWYALVAIGSEVTKTYNAMGSRKDSIRGKFVDNLKPGKKDDFSRMFTEETEVANAMKNILAALQAFEKGKLHDLLEDLREATTPPSSKMTNVMNINPSYEDGKSNEKQKAHQALSGLMIRFDIFKKESDNEQTLSEFTPNTFQDSINSHLKNSREEYLRPASAKGESKNRKNLDRYWYLNEKQKVEFEEAYQNDIHGSLTLMMMMALEYRRLCVAQAQLKAEFISAFEDKGVAFKLSSDDMPLEVAMKDLLGDSFQFIFLTPEWHAFIRHHIAQVFGEEFIKEIDNASDAAREDVLKDKEEIHGMKIEYFAEALSEFEFTTKNSLPHAASFQNALEAIMQIRLLHYSEIYTIDNPLSYETAKQKVMELGATVDDAGETLKSLAVYMYNSLPLYFSMNQEQNNIPHFAVATFLHDMLSVCLPSQQHGDAYVLGKNWDNYLKLLEVTRAN